MARFKAEKIDLTLEIETLDGTVKTFEPTKIMNTKNINLLYQKWQSFEEANDKKKKVGTLDEDGKPLSPELIKENNYTIIAKEIKMMYSAIESHEWLLENLVPSTLKAILDWLIGQLSDVKKKEPSSTTG